MRDRQRESTPLDSLELAAILEEVRQAILAVDKDTGEHRPLRKLTLTPGDTTEKKVVGR